MFAVKFGVFESHLLTCFGSPSQFVGWAASARRRCHASGSILIRVSVRMGQFSIGALLSASQREGCLSERAEASTRAQTLGDTISVLRMDLRCMAQRSHFVFSCDHNGWIRFRTLSTSSTRSSPSINIGQDNLFSLPSLLPLCGFSAQLATALLRIS
jgi:hypothetical protein